MRYPPPEPERKVIEEVPHVHKAVRRIGKNHEADLIVKGFSRRDELACQVIPETPDPPACRSSLCARRILVRLNDHAVDRCRGLVWTLCTFRAAGQQLVDFKS